MQILTYWNMILFLKIDAIPLIVSIAIYFQVHI